VRRIAVVALLAAGGLALLLTGASWAGDQYTLKLVNKSSSEVKIEVFQPRPDSLTDHHEVKPGESFHAADIPHKSCVSVRVLGDAADSNAPCENNPTPLDVRCDVPSGYSCEAHRNQMNDVIVVTVVQPGA